jgi:branched-chain amino acid transport system ATP-binding protein
MLEVAGLYAGYGAIRILDDVTFAAPRGAVTCVLGHNGMGKTTLLRSLIGELKAERGSIRLDGVDITRWPTHRRALAGLGYVPQGREIIPHLSVRENLLMGEVARAGPSAIPEVLEQFPILADLMSRPGGGLSGGQQQILALARCLVGRPKLIMMDEPTEGIQPSIVDLIAKTLTRLCRETGLTVLLVEQDLGFIEALAERVLILQKGRVVQEIYGFSLSESRR